MRNVTLGIVVLALAGVSVLAAVAANHAGKSASSSRCSVAGNGSCATAGPVAATGCAPTGGNIAGNFDPAMSGVCRHACATKLAYGPGEVLAQPGAEPAKLTQCPVSGVVFMVDATRPRVRIAGNDYATCCDRCATQLKRDPHHYLKI